LKQFDAVACFLVIKDTYEGYFKRKYEKGKEPLRIDFGRSILKNPTAEKLLRLLSFHSIITMDGKQIVFAKNGKVDHLRKLLQLLGLSLESG
jgi:hypothetical protein